MRSFSSSWQLIKQSAAVLSKDKELLWFPLLSGICEILILISFALPLFYSGIINSNNNSEGINQILSYVLIFIFYFINYFTVTFFTVGLVYCADKRLKGQDPTFREGMQFASKNLSKIFSWVLLLSTVGLVLRVISDKAGIFGKIFASGAGIVWSLVTFLIIPVLIFDNKGVMDSAKYSVELFKKTWGEQLSGSISMSLIFFLLGFIPLIGILAIMLYLVSAELFSIPLLVVVGIIYLAYVLFLMIASTSLQGIFTAALYIYAKTGTVPSAFTPELIKGAFKTKQTPSPK